jgi:hypothetical protein
MTCRTTQHDKAISARQGAYIDLKKEPQRIDELSEATEWPALGDFIRQINDSTVDERRTAEERKNGIATAGS